MRAHLSITAPLSLVCVTMAQRPFAHVLALDTSVRQASAGLLIGDAVHVSEARADVQIVSQLPELALTLLRDHGLTLEMVDLFAVVSGPGGFTGLRVGIATIQGLALALDRPVVAVPTLDTVACASAVLAPPAPGEVRTVAMAGQRGERFVAQYQWSATDGASPLPFEVRAPFVCRASDGLDHERLGLTPAAQTVLRVSDDEPVPAASAEDLLIVRGALASTVVRLARALALRGASGRPHAVQPRYVRRSDAELTRDRTQGLDIAGARGAATHP